jgi:hypothetical protein
MSIKVNFLPLPNQLLSSSAEQLINVFTARLEYAIAYHLDRADSKSRESSEGMRAEG